MTKYHSPELADKILEFCNTCNNRGGSEQNMKIVYDALFEMGPSCFFDNMLNAAEARGAIKALDWLLVMVNSAADTRRSPGTRRLTESQRISNLNRLERLRSRLRFEIMITTQKDPDEWNNAHPNLDFACIPFDNHQFWLFSNQEDLDTFKASLSA